LPGLQRAHAPSPKKPHAFFFGGAVDDFNLIICRGVIERITGVLLKELKEGVPPWVVQEREEFLSEGLQLVDADRLNGLLNRFAPRREDTFNVKVFWFYNVYLVLVSVTEGKSLGLSHIAFSRLALSRRTIRSGPGSPGFSRARDPRQRWHAWTTSAPRTRRRASQSFDRAN